MPKITILPHPEICPKGAEFEIQEDESLCEAALRNGIKIEHACELSCACTTCHVIVRKGFGTWFGRILLVFLPIEIILSFLEFFHFHY